MKHVLVNGLIRLIVRFPGFMESSPFKAFMGFLCADASQLPFYEDFFDLALISNREELKKTLEKLGFVTKKIEGTGNGAYIILRGANGGSKG